MRIAIYGATGMVGSQITAEAVRRGHEVAAISRRGTPVAGATAGAASLDDVKTFQGVAAGNEAVVIAIPPPRAGEPHEPFLAAHRAIAGSKIAARIFVIGGAGVRGGRPRRARESETRERALHGGQLTAAPFR